jgi:hypothetical protein
MDSVKRKRKMLNTLTATKNRRSHDRLELNLNVLCQTVGMTTPKAFAGTTLDVSTGGALVELDNAKLADGQLLSIEMTLPPTEGLLEYGGRFTSYARVSRVTNPEMDSSIRASSSIKKVALEFCKPPKLSI